MNVQPIIKPAVVDTAGEERDYMPRVNWKAAGIIVGCLALLTLSYLYQRKLQIEAQQARVWAFYDRTLGAQRGQYKEWLEHLTKIVKKAQTAQPFQSNSITPLITTLRNQQGVFFQTDALARENVAETSAEDTAGEQNKSQSAVLSCAGLEAIALEQVAAKGAFLEPRWFRQRYVATNLMKLRVLEDELRRHARQDLPALRRAWEASWLLLTQKANTPGFRKVSLWDLKKESLLFAGEFETKADLLPAAYQRGAKTTKRTEPVNVSATHLADCALGRAMSNALGHAMPDALSQRP